MESHNHNTMAMVYTYLYFAKLYIALMTRCRTAHGITHHNTMARRSYLQCDIQAMAVNTVIVLQDNTWHNIPQYHG